MKAVQALALAGSFAVASLLTGCAVAQNGIAQTARQALEDRGLEQEVLDGGRLLVEDFLHQIVQDEAVTASEGLDKS